MALERFTVELAARAGQDLKRVRPWTDQARTALLQLETDPYRGHTFAGSLSGARSLEFSRPSGGAYRAVSIVLADEGVCVVFIIGPYENVYAKATRRVAALKRSGHL